MSRFYRKFGHITIAGDLIGSRMPGGSSSVIMAYWPGRGNTLTNIDYARMKVGVVQYFKSHLLVYHNGGVLHKDEHVFAYILWILTMTGMVYQPLYVPTHLKVLVVPVYYLFSV